MKSGHRVISRKLSDKDTSLEYDVDRKEWYYTYKLTSYCVGCNASPFNRHVEGQPFISAPDDRDKMYDTSSGKIIDKPKVYAGKNVPHIIEDKRVKGLTLSEISGLLAGGTDGDGGCR